ncbi:YceI family protein [Lysobacter sp. KIS68-7]|uniref:YceI family protein n=1 Tax=Lysobacter sp. KIS68-7 TaxID=2904252 RepID=UPI001E584187|nr:YceI family protein [Lysobacter sp. KIS68-7]UHQ21170.1 YceI family protein [Lysobacter sp. KIS68-7]
MNLKAVPLLFALLLATSAHAEQATYALDPVHTRVMFSVSHAGFSNPMATISGTTGTLVFDPDDWSKAHVEAHIPLKRLELGDPKWNAAVLAPKFLDADKHPEAVFVSTRVEPIDAMHATVIGNLTIRGVTREVKLNVTLNQVKRHPLPPFHRTAGFSATTHVSRKDFAMTAWQSVVGDAVEIRLEVEGARTRGGKIEEEGPAGASSVAAPGSVEPAPATTVPSPADAEPAPASTVAPPPASAPTNPP